MATGALETWMTSIKKYWTILIVFTALATLTPLEAQEPVVGAAEPEALFRSTDPKLNANKQVVYGFFAIYWKPIIGNWPTNI